MIAVAIAFPAGCSSAFVALCLAVKSEFPPEHHGGVAAPVMITVLCAVSPDGDIVRLVSRLDAVHHQYAVIIGDEGRERRTFVQPIRIAVTRSAHSSASAS
jgi:hypothetical protein